MSRHIEIIKLGSPTQIIGGACENASITVQSMQNCNELILKDGDGKCTVDGALTTMLNLIKQRNQETL